MSEKEKIRYEKAARRTKPYTIRFDEEKFDFFTKREKLKSAQQIMDFFMNKYWWENKLPHVTAKEAPPLELKAEFQDLTKPTNEIKPFEQPKTNYEVKMPPKPENIPLGSYEAFRIAILETTMTKSLEKIMREVKAALMPNKQKQMLEAIAKDHSKDFFTD